MPKKRRGPAFTLDLPQPLPVEQEGEHWWFEHGDRRVRLSNLDKVFWPEEGYTKGDLVAYYYNVADRILPYLRDRPLTMKRMPDGAFGQFFYEKNAPPNTPTWMPGCAVETTGDGGRWASARDPRQYRSSRERSPNKDWIQYLMVDDVAALLFVVNMGCVEFHPLHSRCGNAERPDYLFFDLDPFDVAFDTVLTVARFVKVVCDQFGLRAYPKTSGATGMQIYVPIRPEYTYGQVREFVGRTGQMIRKADPARVTMEWEIANRTGRVFIDHNMNRQGANIAAVYSVRPEPEATVSTPLTWDEVDTGDVRPSDFTIATVWDRFTGDDPFRAILAADQDLGPALEAMGVPLEDELPDTRSFPIELPPKEKVEQPGDAPVPAPTDGASKSRGVIARSKDPKLDRYLEMRDLGETPEPGGGDPTPTGNSFVIQKHDATRIHYDLRLERDGVLVSWAVPKGLPLVKGERHLAVQTEDHPMEYASFEGTIPKGHYGAGEVRIWDKGTYDLLEWTPSKVSFRLHGERHRGEYHLIKTRTDWLVFLSKPEEAPPEGPPRFLPMLATAGYEPFDEEGWWFEPKLDGIRTLLYLEMNTARLFSRSGRDQTAGYPELSRLFERVTAENAVLDGEIVALDEQTRPSFELLQQRMNLTSPADIERMRRKIPVELVVFDILWLDGQDLTSRPHRDRREVLERVVVGGERINVAYGVERYGQRFYEAAKDLRLEGVIAKRSASVYTPGKRSSDWRKIKILNRQDCVILGMTPGQGGRGGSFGALLLGAYDGGSLRWIGQVGTGFTERTIDDLLERFDRIAADEPAVDDVELRKVKGARWVRPELVCEVEFLQMTNAGKLRAPSFKGLRTDKVPDDCVLERPAG